MWHRGSSQAGTWDCISYKAQPRPRYHSISHGRNPESSSNHVVKRRTEALWSTQQTFEQVVRWAVWIWWAFWQAVTWREGDQWTREERTFFYASSLERKSICYPKQAMQDFLCSQFQRAHGVLGRGNGSCQLLRLIEEFTTPSNIGPWTPKFKSPALYWWLAWKQKQTNTKDSLKSRLYPKPDNLTLGARWELWIGKGVGGELKSRMRESGQ